MTEDEFVRWVGEWLFQRGFKGTSGNYLGHLLHENRFELEDLVPEMLIALAATVPDDSQLSPGFTPIAYSHFKGAAHVLRMRWNDIMNIAAAPQLSRLRNR